ncbi:50S ribosomal protein L1 [Carex littledalei]|uniref:Ribosomal protein n=1 Tax=Carex littledalei TaxID=544730 RepID=A0A833RBZ4_9POAL|nr:50S ribosomal protein L1 [Carex littledalei]
MASSIIATPSHTLSPPAALSSAKLGAAPPSLFLALSSHHSPFPSLTLSCPNLRFLVSIKQLTHRAVAGATAAELDDKEEEEEEKDDGSVTKGLAYTPPTKPKKGKAALPYKRDRTRSKRFLEVQKSRDWTKDHDVPSAIMLMKQMASTKFVESAEAHFRLNLDPKYADQQLRASVNLPKGTGQKVKVAVLAQGEKLDEAEKAGADIFGADELIEKIKEGFMGFDKLIASPEMMPKVATLGRILGPRGLMPNPKAGTVSSDITQAINEFKKGKVEYRVDKTGIVHVLFGKVNFPDEDLIENFMEIVRSVGTNKPKGAKGVYWRSAYICSTMGPSIRLNVKQMLEYKPPPSV